MMIKEVQIMLTEKEIKYRAWEKNLKEMITVDSIDFERKIINKECAWRMFSEVVLMQFIGLKDVNGIGIYEGDVCESLLGVKGIVVFDKGEYKLKNEQSMYGITKLPKIIGNVFENPELLEN